MNSYLGHSNIIPSTPFIVSYHLSAARHHTSLVPEYIIMSYPPKTAVLTSAILFTACCTRTAISVLIFHFYLCLTAVCLFLVRECSALATLIITFRVYLSRCLSGCQDVCLHFKCFFCESSCPNKLIFPYLGKISGPHG